MKNLDLNLCEYSDKVPLNEEGSLDDFQNGKYGYRVFYEVPKSELDRTGIFEGEDYTGGELEFSVDGNGNLDGEVLLWYNVEDSDCIENIDFVRYNEDISQLVEDFNSRENEKDER